MLWGRARRIVFVDFKRRCWVIYLKCLMAGIEAPKQDPILAKWDTNLNRTNILGWELQNKIYSIQYELINYLYSFNGLKSTWIAWLRIKGWWLMAEFITIQRLNIICSADSSQYFMKRIENFWPYPWLNKWSLTRPDGDVENNWYDLKWSSSHRQKTNIKILPETSAY